MIQSKKYCEECQMVITEAPTKSGNSFYHAHCLKSLQNRKLLDSALGNQVAGDHYKSMVIQPVEFCQKNNLNLCEASVVKYVCRHKSKNGAEDIKKAIHFLELLLELEYNEE